MFQIAMFTFSCSLILPRWGKHDHSFLGEARGTSGDQRTWGANFGIFMGKMDKKIPRGQESPHESFEIAPGPKNLKKKISEIQLTMAIRQYKLLGFFQKKTDKFLGRWVDGAPFHHVFFERNFSIVFFPEFSGVSPSWAFRFQRCHQTPSCR